MPDPARPEHVPASNSTDFILTAKPNRTGDLHQFRAGWRGLGESLAMFLLTDCNLSVLAVPEYRQMECHQLQNAWYRCLRGCSAWQSSLRCDSRRFLELGMSGVGEKREQGRPVGRAKTVSVSQPFIHDIQKRFSTVKPLKLRKKESHGVVQPVGRVVSTVRGQ